MRRSFQYTKPGAPPLDFQGWDWTELTGSFASSISNWVPQVSILRLGKAPVDPAHKQKGHPIGMAFFY
jgi:hypothetical protein